MKHRLALSVAIVALLSSLACDSSKTYPVTFFCDPNGGAACPPGTSCPALTLGTDTCGDLPGLFGHPTTPVKMGRPVGCVVGLSYGNPYYGDTQQKCICSTQPSSTPPPAPRWLCPV